MPFARSEEYVSHTKVGDEVPAFSVTTLEGKEINIAALKGKVVFLNFWATWCPPCHAEMPRLQKEIWERHKGNNFEMIAIVREQTGEEIIECRQKYKYSFPMGADPKRKIYARFADAGIPRNYIIDPNGNIIYQSFGYSSGDFDEMVRVLDKAIFQRDRSR